MSMLGVLALIVQIVFLSLAALATFFYIGMIFGFWHGAPFVPSSHATVRDMIALARIHPGERVYDLGSGDGRILIAAARAGAQAYGWEIHPMLVWLTRVKARWSGLRERVRVERGSYWQANWRDADVIMLYLITGFMQEFKDKLLREARPGTRVVSHCFKVPGWDAVEERGDVRLYSVPRSAD